MGVNINAFIGHGELDLTYECGGVMQCKYALCTEMPPTGEEDCFDYHYGACDNQLVREVGLKALRDRLTRELRRIAEGE